MKPIKEQIRENGFLIQYVILKLGTTRPTFDKWVVDPDMIPYGKVKDLKNLFGVEV